MKLFPPFERKIEKENKSAKSSRKVLSILHVGSFREWNDEDKNKFIWPFISVIIFYIDTVLWMTDRLDIFETMKSYTDMKIPCIPRISKMMNINFSYK